MNQPGNAWRNLLPGVVMIVLGTLFLLDKFFYLNFSWYFRTWWPLLLIAFGVLQLVSRPRHPIGPFVLIAVGVIFQVDRLDLFYWWNMHRMWPLILIAIGVAMLLARLRGNSSSTPRGGDGGPADLGSMEVKS